jgi:hypothetical protein
MMAIVDLKTQILQILVQNSQRKEWTFGTSLDVRFGLKDDGRERKRIIEQLRLEGWIIIADKGKGYIITSDEREFNEYYEKVKHEAISTFYPAKIMKHHLEKGTPLFMQDFILQKEAEHELEEAAC